MGESPTYVAIGALATAVGILWRQIAATASECNRDRWELWAAIAQTRQSPPPPPSEAPHGS